MSVKTNPRKARRRRRTIRARKNPRKCFVVCASTNARREAGYFDGKKSFYAGTAQAKKYSSALAASRAMLKLKNKMPPQATSLWVKAC